MPLSAAERLCRRRPATRRLSSFPGLARVSLFPGLHFVAPPLDLSWGFLFAASVKPFDYFLVACALLDLRFEIVAFHSFETKKHVIERTIEMIFANVPSHERAAFVDRSAKYGIAANSNVRTTRRFPAQIFSGHFLFHISDVSNQRGHPAATCGQNMTTRVMRRTIRHGQS
jgi:hypothetical protein